MPCEKLTGPLTKRTVPFTKQTVPFKKHTEPSGATGVVAHFKVLYTMDSLDFVVAQFSLKFVGTSHSRINTPLNQYTRVLKSFLFVGIIQYTILSPNEGVYFKQSMQMNLHGF